MQTKVRLLFKLKVWNSSCKKKHKSSSVKYINSLILRFFFFPSHSQEHFPCAFPRPEPGTVSHAAGQRRLPQATVAELSPQRYFRPPAPQRALHTHPAWKRRSLQAPPFLRVRHRPHGGDGRELPAADLSVCTQLAMQQHILQPHHDVPFIQLIVDNVNIFVDVTVAHITQNQKRQEVSLFFREEKRDYGVK